MIGASFTMRPATPGGSRIPSSAQLAIMEAALVGTFYGDDGIRMISLAEEAATPNLIVTCHAAFCSPEGMIEMRTTSAKIARAAVLGQAVWNRVN